MKIRLVSILLSMLLTTNVFATVDYLVVNHMTKQLYWAETDHSPGWIGWESIPDGIWASEEKKYLEMGYSITDNPFLIEEVIALMIVLPLLTFWIVRNKKRKNALQQSV